MVLLVFRAEKQKSAAAAAFEVPQAGAVDLIDIAGAAGDQLGGFLQGVVLAVALAGQAQDQLLLGAHTFQML
jgi:glutamate synthase domain-containing protein 3